jgi:hypothetical protein
MMHTKMNEPIPYVYFSTGIKYPFGTDYVGSTGGQEEVQADLGTATRTWTADDIHVMYNKHKDALRRVRDYPLHMHGTLQLLTDLERSLGHSELLFASIVYHQLHYEPIVKADYEIPMKV